MYCNQIFSILKKKVEPVIETPVEDIPLEEEVIEETTPEEVGEPTEPETISETDPEEVTPEETPGEEPIEEETETEEPVEDSTETDPEDPIEESPTYVIANIIVCASYEIASRIARCEFGESALAIDTTLFPVTIGDTYRDGVFYDSLGNVIERNLTESEQIEALTIANEEQKKTIELQAEEIALLNETLLEMLMG